MITPKKPRFFSPTGTLGLRCSTTGYGLRSDYAPKKLVFSSNGTQKPVFLWTLITEKYGRLREITITGNYG